MSTLAGLGIYFTESTDSGANVTWKHSETRAKSRGRGAPVASQGDT